ncbi:hypothetical protein BJ508DRAFT_347237 [Ascobolus immersus RN42]|uniref:Uncharacterized protein n=1 Tax=Ascobolus immersus RN42 TaxID=1160509 RepID=A0A3N4I2R6_ASCIM|nr:hypothetical protein BJ508DRAFT_347237 [Ascobolus immersus RN42]
MERHPTDMVQQTSAEHPNATRASEVQSMHPQQVPSHEGPIRSVPCAAHIARIMSQQIHTASIDLDHSMTKDNKLRSLQDPPPSPAAAPSANNVNLAAPIPGPSAATDPKTISHYPSYRCLCYLKDDAMFHECFGPIGHEAALEGHRRKDGLCPDSLAPLNDTTTTRQVQHLHAFSYYDEERVHTMPDAPESAEFGFEAGVLGAREAENELSFMGGWNVSEEQHDRY